MKVKKQSCKIFTEEEIGRLLSLADSGMRDLILIIKESGCRIHEVLGLRGTDIEFQKSYAVMHVDGKTGQRDVPVMLCRGVLMRLARKNGNRKLFRNPYITWHHRLESLKKMAGVFKDVNFHGFRHYATSYWLRHGMPESVAKKMLGWTQGSNMLNVYSHMYIEDVVDHMTRINSRQESPGLWQAYN
jgi:integrase